MIVYSRYISANFNSLPINAVIDSVAIIIVIMILTTRRFGTLFFILFSLLSVGLWKRRPRNYRFCCRIIEVYPIRLVCASSEASVTPITSYMHTSRITAYQYVFTRLYINVFSYGLIKKLFFNRESSDFRNYFKFILVFDKSQC